MREFAEDMTELARSRRTAFGEPAADNSPAKTWLAADLDIRGGGKFMMGTLGFSEAAERRQFNSEEWSWIKGDTAVSDTASEETVVPFAIDLRNSHRWVAFATTARLQPTGFTKGLQEILNQAVADQGNIPTEWDVDLITSRSSVDAWLRNHPLVHKMRRTVKFSNPGRDIDADRQEMQALTARRKTEEFAAARNGVLNTDSEEFRSKLNGTETGDLELELSARGDNGLAEATFKSKELADHQQIDDFGRDLTRGMQDVLGALREYVAGKT